MVISHLNKTPGYVKETANNVHVVVSSGASGGDYERGSEQRVIDTSKWWLGLGCLGVISDASCFPIMVYLELLELVM